MGGSGYVTTGIGTLVGIPAGAFSLWAICRVTSDNTYRILFSLETSAGSSRLSLWLSNTNTVQLSVAASDKDTGVPASSSDGWMLVGVSKESGSSIPRGHKHVYSTNTWTHADAAAASSGDSGDLTAGRVQIGRWQTSTERWPGEILLCGAVKRALTDAEWEQLPYTLPGALGVTPDALWLLDQHATTQNVIDLTGGGANQTALTGTSTGTSSVPVWNYGTGASVGVGQTGGGSTHNADATAVTTATITAAAVADRPATASLTATATVSPAATTTKPATATLTTAAGITADTASTKSATADRTTTATLTTAATAVKPADATLTATATITAAAAVGAAPVDITATPTLTATITPAATATRPAPSTLTGTAAISSTAALTKPTTATLTATTAIAATASVTPAAAAIVARPNTGTTSRPGTGVVPRPFTGIVTRP
ncbi:hypothetical protein Drose_04175 [Dactylosporangium roseum]|uniref:Uncharacterized protein n=1 Tax=Dactylosporangium roseum TaxID=47989 RepID=A0ABY5Z7C2_9ACTN|nr:hypothetical protein [Dactylosporangium roseum]UWZ37486.1 hypothetical protein Drose_04175 [Dactylosporangium roseum]